MGGGRRQSGLSGRILAAGVERVVDLEYPAQELW